LAWGRKSIPGRHFILVDDPEIRLVAVRPARGDSMGAAVNLPENRNLFPHGLDTETIVCQRDNQRDGGTVGAASR
jgi:hypothetical protein